MSFEAYRNFGLKPLYTTVQSKRKFTLATARHASPRNITRARIASRGTNTRNEKQRVDKKYLAAKKVHSPNVYYFVY